MAYGLCEVVPGRIWQVRGFDLANIGFVKSDTGWIVFDPLTAKETAKAALDFINEKLGKRPVVAVVYSHFLRNKRGKGTIGATRILC
jgi:alkyl sulfatase BDS1-like metallo-beta-lactamase superfamily hydrolase